MDNNDRTWLNLTFQIAGLQDAVDCVLDVSHGKDYFHDDAGKKILVVLDQVRFLINNRITELRELRSTL